MPMKLKQDGLPGVNWMLSGHRAAKLKSTKDVSWGECGLLERSFI